MIGFAALALVHFPCGREADRFHRSCRQATTTLPSAASRETRTSSGNTESARRSRRLPSSPVAYLSPTTSRASSGALKAQASRQTRAIPDGDHCKADGNQRGASAPTASVVAPFEVSGANFPRDRSIVAALACSRMSPNAKAIVVRISGFSVTVSCLVEAAVSWPAAVAFP